MMRSCWKIPQSGASEMAQWVKLTSPVTWVWSPGTTRWQETVNCHKIALWLPHVWHGMCSFAPPPHTVQKRKQYTKTHILRPLSSRLPLRFSFFWPFLLYWGVDPVLCIGREKNTTLLFISTLTSLCPLSPGIHILSLLFSQSKMCLRKLKKDIFLAV